MVVPLHVRVCGHCPAACTCTCDGRPATRTCDGGPAARTSTRTCDGHLEPYGRPVDDYLWGPEPSVHLVSLRHCDTRRGEGTADRVQRTLSGERDVPRRRREAECVCSMWVLCAVFGALRGLGFPQLKGRCALFLCQVGPPPLSRCPDPSCITSGLFLLRSPFCMGFAAFPGPAKTDPTEE